jgi:peptide/nickel transport system ATP-binding protein
MTTPLLEVADLVKHFPVNRGVFGRGGKMLRAVDGVSFAVNAGETLCIVGESGCGKSTVARLLLRLLEPTSGRIAVDGADVTALDAEATRQWRRRVQMVFQDPYASLNPRLTAAQIVTEPVENFQALSGSAREELAAGLLRRVGLRPEAARLFPFEFSGGQRQRLGVARALSLQPALIVADEPVSALDVSVQAQILNLLLDLQEETGIAFVFISHDLGVVQHVAHRVAVMYLGRIVELADCDALFAAPAHPYTEALIEAAPIPDPRRARLSAPLEGEVPSAVDPPPGCTFHPRCPIAVARCRVDVPVLTALPGGRSVACHVRGVG